MRKVGLLAVVLGALALSFAGQVSVVAPLLGTPLAVVFALTHDIATLLALSEVMSTVNTSVRRWAWTVLVLAGGTSLGLNTFHTIHSAVLPLAASIVVGAGPVVLAGVLSHLAALAMTTERQEAKATSHQAGDATSHQDAEHQATRPVARQVIRQAATTNPAQPGDLQERARKLLAESAAAGQVMGRGRLAQALGVTGHQARQLLAQITSETTSHQVLSAA